jgi:chromosome partitioning protein
MLKVAVFNFKGGTGKSTTVLNLGASLAKLKSKVIMLDLDGQRTLSFGLGLDGETPTALDLLVHTNVDPKDTTIANLHLIPGDLGLFQLTTKSDLITPALSELKGLGFDICLMDCSPGLGVASVQAILSSDLILIPVICEPAVLKGLSEAVQLIREERPNVAIEVLRCRHRSRLLITKEAEKLLVEGQTELNYRLLETTIPENIAVAEAIAHFVPVTVYAPCSVGAKAYKTLAKEFKKKWL